MLCLWKSTCISNPWRGTLYHSLGVNLWKYQSDVTVQCCIHIHLAFSLMYLIHTHKNTHTRIHTQTLTLFFILQKGSLNGNIYIKSVHSLIWKNCIEMVKNQNRVPLKRFLSSNASVWRVLHGWKHWRNEGDFCCLLCGLNKGSQLPNTLHGVEKTVISGEELMPPHGFPGAGSPANVYLYGSGKPVVTG